MKYGVNATMTQYPMIASDGVYAPVLTFELGGGDALIEFSCLRLLWDFPETNDRMFNSASIPLTSDSISSS
jgi:hypothetical protein